MLLWFPRPLQGLPLLIACTMQPAPSNNCRMRHMTGGMVYTCGQVRCDISLSNHPACLLAWQNICRPTSKIEGVRFSKVDSTDNRRRLNGKIASTLAKSPVSTLQLQHSALP